MILIDGKKVAAEIREELKKEVAKLNELKEKIEKELKTGCFGTINVNAKKTIAKRAGKQIARLRSCSDQHES